MSKPLVGAQLYTLREHTKTLPDLQETLKKVADIGYTTIQVSGVGPIDPEDIAKAAADANLEIATTHMGWPRFQTELDAVIAEHKIYNCKHPAVGGVPKEYHCEGGAHKFIEELKPIAAKLAEEGMDFSFHNHNQEFVKYTDRTWLAELYEDSSPDVLKAEIDTYWITAGGGDPAAWIDKVAGRMPILHLKDMCIVEGREQRFAPIGEGNLNWERIFKAAESAGVDYMMIEQDQCYGKDPFDELAISYRYLSSMGYK